MPLASWVWILSEVAINDANSKLVSFLVKIIIESHGVHLQRNVFSELVGQITAVDRRAASFLMKVELDCMDAAEKQAKSLTRLQGMCVDAMVEQFCDDVTFCPTLPAECPAVVYNELLRRLSDPPVISLRGALVSE